MKHLTILLFAAWVLFSVTGPAFAVPDAAVPETADTPAASEPSSGASDPAAAVSEGSPFQPGAVSADPQAKTASEPVSSESGAPVSAPDDYAVYCVMPDAARSSLRAFRLGTTVEEAQPLGAAPTVKPDMLQLPIREEEEWTGVAQFKDGKAVSLVLFTHMDAELPDRLFDCLRAEGFMPATVQPASGADLYQLAAQGKDSGACWDALKERVGAFSGGDGEVCTVLFVPKAFFDDLAGAAGDRAGEEAAIRAHAADRVFAVTLDKAASQLVYLVASWEYLAQP